MNRTTSPEGSDIHRTHPHSIDAEKGLLSSMLLAPDFVIDEVVGRVSAAKLYLPSHQTIFELIVEMHDKRQAVDIITLTNVLQSRKQLDSIGGAYYITHLYGFVPTAANADFYVDIVVEKYLLRQLIATCTELVTLGYDDPGDVNALIDNAEAAILAIRENSTEEEEDSTMKEQVMEAIEHIEQLYENRGKLSGLSTGFKRLDEMTGGAKDEDMIVIAARPSMGKSALLGNLIEHMALVEKVPVGVFSLEMSTQQFVQRFLCSRARVNMQKVRDGFMSERDFPNLTTAAAKLAESKIYFDSRSGLSIMQVRAKARRWKKRHGIKVLCIDYLQLIKSQSRRAQNSTQAEITEVSNGLKALARELKVPIIVLAQLNRNPENRGGGKPRLSDLKDSGAIEQDADIVGLLIRGEYYAEDDEQKEEMRGEAVLDIAKNRNGPVGEIKLTFLKEYTRFEDRADTINNE